MNEIVNRLQNKTQRKNRTGRGKSEGGGWWSVESDGASKSEEARHNTNNSKTERKERDFRQRKIYNETKENGRLHAPHILQYARNGL